MPSTDSSTTRWPSLACLLVLSLSSVTLAVHSFASCTDSLFVGFDSRLATELLARLPSSQDPIRGFEIVNGKPVVAFPHRLLAFAPDQLASFPSLDPIEGISADGAGRLRLQSPHKISIVRASQIEPDVSLSGTTAGHLLDSGNPLLLEARSDDQRVRFIARRPDGASLPLMTVPGQFRTASWNRAGLAAVVGDTLLVWPAGARQAVRLASDIGLRSAQDVCLVGPDRAVVTLPHVVLLVTSKTQLVLVGIPALCRWNQGTLFLLDRHSGMIWTVKGMEKLGDPASDAAHANELLRAIPKTAAADDSRFLEAARILGCNKAEALLSSATSPR
jgi:hypothetical protein